MAKTVSRAGTMIPGLLPDPKAGPTDQLECAWRLRGAPVVAGVDEAGRGPLAGPVVAAAVILPSTLDSAAAEALALLNDSKTLTARRREALYKAIMDHADAVATCSICAASIDAGDIRKASLEAMRRSLANLAIAPDAALFDGRDIPSGLPNGLKRQAVIKGDAISVSIAAASIIAKVTRDRMMDLLGSCHPVYGLEGHMGYGSAMHRDAIMEHGGVTRVHRFSFRPLRA